MSDLKLTIDQLKNYLGTGLKIEPIIVKGFNHGEPMAFLDFHAMIVLKTNGVFVCKPICYRLSDLDKFITELGFVPIEEIEKLNLGHCDWITKERNHWIEKYGLEKWIGDIPFTIIKKLFQWHFWPFGDEYFEAGLVIDKLK